ncbi:MAG: dihydrofolate reductase family protein [Candidatus Sericytochromatia bacterium]
MVLTTKKLDIPKDLKDKVRIENLEPKDLINKLSQEGKKNLYIDGGKTIQSFIDNKLIDEMIITQIPILLGKGIRLFDESDNEYHLDLIDSQKSDNGFVQSRYKNNILKHYFVYISVKNIFEKILNS